MTRQSEDRIPLVPVLGGAAASGHTGKTKVREGGFNISFPQKRDCEGSVPP